MSISGLVTKQSFAGNDSTTAFAIAPIEFEDSTEIRVILRDNNVTPSTETVQTSGVDYTFSGGPPVTTVDMTVPPATGEILFIKRQSTEDQPLNFQNTSGLDVEVNEDGLDHGVLLVQELLERFARTPILAETTPTTGLVWPEPLTEGVIKYNTAANQLVTIAPADLLSLATAGLLVAANNLSDLTDDGAALANLLQKGSDAIPNNQSVAADVTGWLISSASFTSAQYMVEVNRPATTRVMATFMAHLQFYDGSWRIFTGGWEGDTSGGFPAGVDLSITAAGQVQATSTNETGGLSGTIKFQRLGFTV